MKHFSILLAGVSIAFQVVHVAAVRYDQNGYIIASNEFEPNGAWEHFEGTMTAHHPGLAADASHFWGQEAYPRWERQESVRGHHWNDYSQSIWHNPERENQNERAYDELSNDAAEGRYAQSPGWSHEPSRSGYSSPASPEHHPPPFPQYAYPNFPPPHAQSWPAPSSPQYSYPDSSYAHSHPEVYHPHPYYVNPYAEYRQPQSVPSSPESARSVEETVSRSPSPEYVSSYAGGSSSSSAKKGFKKLFSKLKIGR